MKGLSIIAAIVSAVSLSTASLPALAFVMSSQNFRIQADSINVGGARQGSTNFRSEDTIGEAGSDESESTNFRLRAGYQQMLETFISISSPSDVTMSPSIPSSGGGTSNGSAIWTVTTDNLAGYTISIGASTSPALQNGSDSFADYTPAASGTPDFTFSVAASASEFAFTPEGADLIQKFLDNGSSCGVGSSETSNACWYNLSTANQNIAQSSSSNHPSGTASTVKFRAEAGSSKVQTAGTYTATITATAVAN